MSTNQNLLEECTRASKQYAKLVARYKDFFNSQFTNPIQAFGYERCSSNDKYVGLSNMPVIAELFVETEAYEDQYIIIQPKHMSSFCTFIHPDPKYHLKYNDFRNRLEEHLQIRTTFCIIQRHANYFENFVWNYKKPNLSLAEEKRLIISDFIRNSTLISACIKQFKKEITPLLPEEAFAGIDINQYSPLYKNGKHPAKLVGDYRQYAELLHHTQTLERENLSFKDFCLSSLERETIELFLKTPDVSYCSSEILTQICLKLGSLKRSKIFESESNELRRIGLTK